MTFDTASMRNQKWRTQQPHPPGRVREVFNFKHIKIDCTGTSPYDGFRTLLVVDHNPKKICEIGYEKFIELTVDRLFQPQINAVLFSPNRQEEIQATIFFEEIVIEFGRFKLFTERTAKSWNCYDILLDGKPFAFWDKLHLRFAEGERPMIDLRFSPAPAPVLSGEEIGKDVEISEKELAEMKRNFAGVKIGPHQPDRSIKSNVNEVLDEILEQEEPQDSTISVISNGVRRLTPNPNVIQVSRCLMDHRGLEVCEMVLKIDAKHKLLWCRDSFEKIEVDGRPNVCCHVDYSPGLDLAIALRRVREAFDAYWFGGGDLPKPIICQKLVPPIELRS